MHDKGFPTQCARNGDSGEESVYVCAGLNLELKMARGTRGPGLGLVLYAAVALVCAVLAFRAWHSSARARRAKADIAYLREVDLDYHRLTAGGEELGPGFNPDRSADLTSRMRYYGFECYPQVLDEIRAKPEAHPIVMAWLMRLRRGEVESFLVPSRLPPSVTKALEELLAEWRPRLVKQCAEDTPRHLVGWLSNFPGPDVDEIFLSLLDNPDRPVRQTAMSYVKRAVIPKLQTDAERSEVSKRLRGFLTTSRYDETWERAEVHSALCAMGDRNALEELARMSRTDGRAFDLLDDHMYGGHDMAVALLIRPSLAHETELKKIRKKLLFTLSDEVVDAALASLE